MTGNDVTRECCPWYERRSASDDTATHFPTKITTLEHTAKLGREYIQAVHVLREVLEDANLRIHHFVPVVQVDEGTLLNLAKEHSKETDFVQK